MALRKRACEDDAVSQQWMLVPPWAEEADGDRGSKIAQGPPETEDLQAALGVSWPAW